MIGYWHNPVVRLSVCDAVHSGSQSWCTGLKVVQRVPSIGMFLFVPSDTLATNVRTAKTSRRKRERELFFTTTRVLIHSGLVTAMSLLFPVVLWALPELKGMNE